MNESIYQNLKGFFLPIIMHLSPIAFRHHQSSRLTFWHTSPKSVFLTFFFTYNWLVIPDFEHVEEISQARQLFYWPGPSGLWLNSKTASLIFPISPMIICTETNGPIGTKLCRNLCGVIHKSHYFVLIWQKNMTKNIGISNYKLLEPKQCMNNQMSDSSIHCSWLNKCW